MIKAATKRPLENMPRRGSGSSMAGVDRNALERDRRLYMKELFSRLSFLLPSLAAKVCSLLPSLVLVFFIFIFIFFGFFIVS